MQLLEHMLSPIIITRDFLVAQKLSDKEIALVEKIQQLKMDVINQCISPSQVGLVRPEIVESWIRSHNFGLDRIATNKYGPVLEKHSFEELLKEKDFLLKAADSYIYQLESMFNSYVVLLSDERGVLLRVVVGKDDKMTEKEFNMVPGVVWTEETMGTCAHGLCLLLKRPIQVGATEHYCEGLSQVTSSSAPIFDTNHNLAGVLTIGSMHYHHVNSQMLSLAVSMAWAIQNDYNLAVNRELLSATLEAAEEAVITINKNGIITKANMVAKKIFDYLNRELAGEHIETVLGAQPLIKSVLETGKSVVDAEIKLDRDNQSLHLASAHPVQNFYGKNYGCVLTLKKIDRTSKAGCRGCRVEQGFTFDKIVGTSPQIIESINKSKKFAKLDVNILIQGESGTGKEVYAQAIHNESRPDGPFIAINCAAIPKTLIESELFGYEGGAFTGAVRQGKPGKIELADGGTLFLDEIGDMPLEIQPILLRVLEEKKIMRVGGSRYIPVDFRLLVATNKDLLDLVKNNQFREDLYYRLAVFKTYLPPLRERGADIINLAKHFINAVAQRQQIPAPSLSSAAKYRLLQYSWPGNVRQLENAILYAVNMSSNGIIRPEDLPDEIKSAAISCSDQDCFAAPELIIDNTIREEKIPIKEMEKIAVTQALEQAKYRICEAASILGVSRSTMYRKIKEYNLHGNMKSPDLT